MNNQEAKKLEAKVTKQLKKHLSPTDTVIAAISGGPDSIFLLNSLKKIPCKIVVAHIDHGLRKESKAEAKFVQKQSPIFELKTANIKKLSQKLKKGLEEVGREVRYKFFAELAKKYKAKYIITAHHADDNLETIIFNFARGATLQGLLGISEVEPTTKTNTKLLRPLIDISKAQILDYLKFKKIPYKTDKSNDDLIYKRNFIRHKIVPLLKELNPSLTTTLATNIQNLREIRDFLKTSAENFLKTQQTLDAKLFRQQHPALQKEILLTVYKNLVKNTLNLKSINLDETLNLINKNIGNKSKKLGQLTVKILNNKILFSIH
ncbi:MAG: tRNA lysidine(34) synthetase TilS [Patescibacteria group bacterium]